MTHLNNRPQGDKNPQTRKKITIMIACMTVVVCLCVGGVAAGLFVRQMQSNLSPELSALHAHPAFSAVINWQSALGAEYYVLEYKYGYYPGETRTVRTQRTFREVERIQGELQFRVKAVYKRREGEFSDWQSYYIPPLTLAKPQPFTLAQYEASGGTETRIMPGTWNSVGYYYWTQDGGEIQQADANYYEYFVVPPDQDKETMLLHPYIVVAASEFRRQNFSFSSPGKWTVYYRASVFDFQFHQQGYFAERRIDKMYAPTDDWTESSIIIII